jgi:hypothetical protein
MSTRFTLNPFASFRRLRIGSPQTRRKGNPTRPVFDFLEDRLALTANVWTGHAAQFVQDYNWSNRQNWSEGTPVSGQDLEFPPAGATTFIPQNTIINDILGLSLSSIQLYGSGYTIAGKDINLTSATGILTTYSGGISTVGANVALEQGEVSIAVGGELDLDGVVSGNTQLAVVGGGTLGGTGVVNGLALEGSELEPGDAGVGDLECDGGANLFHGSVFTVVIDGSGPKNALVAPGGLAGLVNLHTPTLHLDFDNAPNPIPGSSITIIQGTVAGSFDGLPEGANVPGTPYRISYQHGAVLVVPAPTQAQVTESSGKSRSTFGEALTFQATVTAAAGTPSGSIKFMQDGAVVGTQTLDSRGVATFTTSGLGVGDHVITAVYSGNLGFIGSQSAAFKETVTPCTTATSISSTASEIEYLQSVTFFASVTAIAPGAGVPTGSVTFFDGQTSVGAAPLLSGTARITTTALRVGAHSLTAAYSGDPNFGSSTSPSIVESVDPAETVTSIDASPTRATVNQTVTFTARVAPRAGQSIEPTGQVVFYDGSDRIGESALSNGAAQFSATFSSIGKHTIIDVYGGEGNVQPSGSSIDITIDPAPTQTSLTIEPSGSPIGEPVVFTAHVSAGAVGSKLVPVGTVIFRDGKTQLAVVPLLNQDATWTTSGLAPGSHDVTATFHIGEPQFLDSTSSPALADIGDTKVTLISQSSSSTFGQAVAFTATVAPEPSSGDVPTGSVTFKDGAVRLGTAQLDRSGVASFSSSFLAGGEHSITAVFSGDSHYVASSSNALDQLVNRAGTTITLGPAASQIMFGSSVVFTAKVTSTGGAPEGSVTLRDGDTDLQTVALDSSGNATFSAIDLDLGSHDVVAYYGGTQSFTSSASRALEFEVTRATTRTTLTASATVLAAGQEVVLTALVASSVVSEAGPAGTVVFRDGPNVIGSAPITIGQAELHVALSTAGSPHSIEADYEGSDFYSASNSAVQSVSISPGVATTILHAAPRYAGKRFTGVVLTITVRSNRAGGPVPTGAVNLLLNGRALRTLPLSNGSASLVVSAKQSKQKSVAAQYAGDANYRPAISSLVRIPTKPRKGKTLAVTRTAID